MAIISILVGQLHIQPVAVEGDLASIHAIVGTRASHNVEGDGVLPGPVACTPRRSNVGAGTGGCGMCQSIRNENAHGELWQVGLSMCTRPQCITQAQMTLAAALGDTIEAERGRLQLPGGAHAAQQPNTVQRNCCKKPPA